MVHRQKILPYSGWIGYVCQVLSPRWLKIFFHFWQFWVSFISQNHNQAVELVELFFPLSYTSNIGWIAGTTLVPEINKNVGLYYRVLKNVENLCSQIVLIYISIPKRYQKLKKPWLWIPDPSLNIMMIILMISCC